eukprot:COSAG05_NODE_478_length_9434_cov_5.178897_10_plen_55_part_00
MISERLPEMDCEWGRYSFTDSGSKKVIGTATETPPAAPLGQLIYTLKGVTFGHI